MAPEVRKPTAKRPSQSASRAWDALTPALSEWILEAVSSMGFPRMTPVQASTIPLFTKNSDVVVEAVTGSGKTLAFLIPVVERLLRLEEPLRRHHIGAIIISPTRELATQIHSVLLSLLAFHAPSSAQLQPPNDSSDSPNTVSDNATPAPTFSSSTLKVIPQLLLGGTTTPSQDLAHFLNHSPNLLISTPGRLLELLSSPYVHCPQSSFEVLVLDEADRLLDLGFKEDLQKILQRLPKQRRTGLFSASVSEAVDQLIRVGLRNPIKIAVKVKGASGSDDQRTPASLQMAYLTTPPTHKLPALLSLLQILNPTPLKTIAYLSTCAAVDYFSHLLPSLLAPNSALTIIPLHGKHPPAIRTKNFTRFTTTPTQTLLLTTDVAARGLDIPSVDLTIQLDPPSDPKTFLHRAGRAGRAGRKGLSIVFLLPGRETDEYPSFLSVRKTPVTPLHLCLLPGVVSSCGFTHPSASADAALTIPEPVATQATAALRERVKEDRALHDKGQRAFVSWLRAYSKHEARSIFRVADVEWVAQGEAWGLLKLPRMPEIRIAQQLRAGQGGVGGKEGKNGDVDVHADVGADEDGAEKKTANPRQLSTVSTPIDTTLGLEIDWSRYAYRDLARERKRKDDLLASSSSSSATHQIQNGNHNQTQNQSNPREKQPKAWSTRLGQKATAAARRQRKAEVREKVRERGLSEGERAREGELKGMLEEVRRRVVVEGEGGEWEGFD